MSSAPSDERRLAESAELLAQRGDVERALASPERALISLRTVTVSPSATKTALSGAPALPNSRTSRRDLRARTLGGQRGVARARALEQRRLGRAHDAPAVADARSRRHAIAWRDAAVARDERAHRGRR